MKSARVIVDCVRVDAIEHYIKQHSESIFILESYINSMQHRIDMNHDLSLHSVTEGTLNGAYHQFP